MIEELLYRSYAHNRALSPSVSPFAWMRIYGPSVSAMEGRYRKELAQAFPPKKPVQKEDYDAVQAS